MDGSRGLEASAAGLMPNDGCAHCGDVVDSFRSPSLSRMGRSTSRKEGTASLPDEENSPILPHCFLDDINDW